MTHQKEDQTISRERRKLRELSPHRDTQIFAEPLEAEIERLARDILSRGLQHPIEITPSGEIIAGRRRWLALLHVGEESTVCVVRHDLAAQGEIAVLEHLVNDNIVRRRHSTVPVRERCSERGTGERWS